VTFALSTSISRLLKPCLPCIIYLCNKLRGSEETLLQLLPKLSFKKQFKIGAVDARKSKRKQIKIVLGRRLEL